MNWLNIEHYLPKDYEYVLVYAKMPGTGEPCPISIARHHHNKWEMLNHSPQSNAVACGDLTWEMDEENITHWMPIPPPPKKIRNYTPRKVWRRIMENKK